MKIYWEKLLPLVLVLVLSLLAGRYLGETYLFFFRVMWIITGMDILLYILGWISLRYNQHFSREHLNRGETIHYDFYIQQPRLLRANQVRVDFHRFSLKQGGYPQEMTIELKDQKRVGYEYEIQTRHRGIYEAGIHQITLFDFLGLWEFPVFIFPRTFYVYPRIYNPEKKAPEGLSREGETESLAQAGSDQTFRTLKEYRPGMDLRGISWKHYARTGRPLIREQGVTTSRNRLILMDRRPLPEEREDLLLENTLALINSCRGGREPLRVAGMGSEKPIQIHNDADWDSLIRGTLTIKFNSPGINEMAIAGEEPVTLISALPDGSLLEGEFWRSHPQWQLFALLEGMGDKEQRLMEGRLEMLRLQGVDIIIIKKGEEFWSVG